MTLFSETDRKFARHIGRLVYCNPFVPERIAMERAALGADFVETPAVWSLRSNEDGERANLTRLTERCEPLAEAARARLVDGDPDDVGRADLELYEDLVFYLLYQRDRMDLQRSIDRAREGKGSIGQVRYWKQFKSDYDHFLGLPGVTFPGGYDAAHVFAIMFQIRRAFYHIIEAIVGGSLPMARLRAEVWESIFTHDIGRYSRVLHRHMTDYTTLVMGPSGTGKELVASAIGQARYIPFDADKRVFTEDFSTTLHALNISALSATLIESELFGHKRGAFTGAISDRAGWLEVCRPLGTVFLDEIGELDPAVQVKLLRVLQTRTFQRLGETQDRHFHGKIIAATNRDLAADVAEGGFRADLYYRLCSDIITTPSLQEQLAEDPDDIFNLVLHICRGIVEHEAEPLADEVTGWIHANLGRNYPWPGNFRELEQCVRNVLIRRTYRPRRATAAGTPDGHGDLASTLRACRLTADELLRRYCTLVYAETRSYEEAARRLGLDRRTVRSKVDRALLEETRPEIVLRPPVRRPIASDDTRH